MNTDRLCSVNSLEAPLTAGSQLMIDRGEREFLRIVDFFKGSSVLRLPTGGGAPGERASERSSFSKEPKRLRGNFRGLQEDDST